MEDGRFGAVDGSAALTYVTDVLPAGALTIIADAGAHALVVFSADGRYIRTIGREGVGPGEFRDLTIVGLLGDTIWVSDSDAARQTLFGREGAVLSERRLTSRPTPQRPRSVLAGLLDGGFGWAPLVPAGRIPQPYHTAPIERLDPNGVPLDTVAWTRMGSTSLRIPLGPGGLITLSWAQAFEDGPLWAVAPNGTGIVSVVPERPSRADSTLLTITFTRPDGVRAYRRQVSYRPTPVSGQHVARVVELLLSNPRLAERIPDRAQRERAVREALYVPEYLPAAKQVIAGSDGTVWLRRTGQYSDGDHDLWTVFDPTGAIVASVEVPRDVRVLAADRHNVWAAVQDEIGVPYVVRYRIE